MKILNFVLSVFCIFALILFSGCIETPDAEAAKISDNALTLYGWEQVGTTIYERHNFTIMGLIEVSINTARKTYRNVHLVDNLRNQIDSQILSIRRKHNIPPNIKLPDLPQYEVPRDISTIHTIRIIAPARIELPLDIVREVITPKIESMLTQFNIRDFKKVNTTELIIGDGSVAIFDTYTGKTPFNDKLVTVNIFIVTWASSGSNIVVIGSVPTGEMEVGVVLKEPIIVRINGDQEINEMIEMVKTIR